MTSGLVAIVLLAFAALVYAVHKTRRNSISREDAWRPGAFHGAPIAFAEKKFFTAWPFPLVAKVDRALRIGETITIAELKTRRSHRIYSSDVIELSAQKLALEEGAGEFVNPVAYVVTQHPASARRQTHPVRLLSRSELIGLARRRDRILAGLETPRLAPNRGMCRSCAFYSRCQPDKSQG